MTVRTLYHLYYLTRLSFSDVFQNSVAHSNSAIEKPKTKMQEAVQREIDEAMKKVKEAQSLITAAADSGNIICLFDTKLVYLMVLCFE